MNETSLTPEFEAMMAQLWTDLNDTYTPIGALLWLSSPIKPLEHKRACDAIRTHDVDELKPFADWARMLADSNFA